MHTYIHTYIPTVMYKRSGADFKCAISIWKLLLWTHIMLSKDLSMQVKQTIVRLQKQNKSIREIAGTLGVVKSTVWFILRKKERTSELSNIKRPGRPRRTTVEDDRRILSMVKKNPFTTSSQVKNTLQEVDVSLSSLQSREDFTRANTEGSPQGANKAWLDCQKTSNKARPLLEKQSVDGWN